MTIGIVNTFTAECHDCGAWSDGYYNYNEAEAWGREHTCAN